MYPIYIYIYVPYMYPSGFRPSPSLSVGAAGKARPLRAAPCGEGLGFRGLRGLRGLGDYGFSG